MNRVVPWAKLVGLVTPHAPEGKRGRPPFAVKTTLRIHFMQQLYGLDAFHLRRVDMDAIKQNQVAVLYPACYRGISPIGADGIR